MRVIKLSCALNKVTYKHALALATSRQTLGFHGTDPQWMTASDRSTGENMQRRCPPFVNVHILPRGRSTWRPNAGFQAGVQRPCSAFGAVCVAVLQSGRKHAPACLTGYTNLWRLCFLSRGCRCNRERLFRSEIVSRGLMVELPTPCMIVIRTIAAQDTISSLSELI